MRGGGNGKRVEDFLFDLTEEKCEMKIYDISQEVFSSQVYADNPMPGKKLLCSMESGSLYNLSVFSMCAHNGTHIDAPFHFIKDGKTVDSIGLDTFVGMAYVAEYHGIVSDAVAAEILEKAKNRTQKRQREFLLRETQRFLQKQLKYLPTQKSYCLVTNPRPLGPKPNQWRYTSSCWEPVSYCLKEFV